MIEGTKTCIISQLLSKFYFIIYISDDDDDDDDNYCFNLHKYLAPYNGIDNAHEIPTQASFWPAMVYSLSKETRFCLESQVPGRSLISLP